MQLSEIVSGQPKTELVYLREMNSKRGQAKLLKVVPEKRTNAYLILDRTLFHPKGGGQPSDRGMIHSADFEASIKKTMNHQGVVVHWVKLLRGVPVEGEVTCELDWDYRHLIMRRHTAAHLLDHCLAEATGANVQTTDSWLEDSCYVGYTGTAPSAEILEKTEASANRRILAGGTLSIQFLSPDQAKKLIQNAPNYERLPDIPEIRTVTIAGCQPIPCGGTHVSDLKEIGRVSVLEAEQMPTNSFRLHFSVGENVSTP